MTDPDDARARAALDQVGAEWRSKVADLVKLVRRDLLPLDSGGFGGAIADLASHLHAIAVAGDAQPEAALREMTTLAAAALLRLAVAVEDRDRVIAKAEESQAAVRDIYRRFRHLLPDDMEGAPE